jgi:uncharacterized membrane protein
MTAKMNRFVIVIGLFPGTLIAVSQAAAQGPVPPGLSGEVRDVFQAKCTRCHSDKLAKPKGDFGYVLDLRRLGADHELIVPMDPGRSKFWKLIESGKMPPKSSKDGQLSDPQKALVRWWIELGAPPDEPSTAGAPSRPYSSATGIGMRAVEWIGRFHVLVIHFPIALLLAAALAEAWWMWTGRFGLSPAVRYCVLLGALGALVAAGLGWLRAPYSGYAGNQMLFLHRWAGTAAAAVAITAALAYEYDAARQHRTRFSRATLFVSALLVGLSGHLGGSLVYGTSYFQW